MATQISSTAQTDLRARYLSIRRMTEAVCADLSAEDCMLQSMPTASPVKWHLAHTAWFFETFILTPHAEGYQAENSAFRDLFNSYYNAIGQQPQRDRRGLFSRPSLADVYRYRKHVDGWMLALLESATREITDLVLLGMHHEQQHQELIVTDVKHALWSSPLRSSWKSGQIAKEASPSADLEWHEFSMAEASIGHEGAGFCFDNELPPHRVALAPFQIASRLVTNAEYLLFIEDGGYRRPELWLSDGWQMVHSENWQAPLYWEKRQKDWWHYTVTGMHNVERDASLPVTHISFYEADAYARWIEARLPTEFEWEIAARALGEVGTGSFLDSGLLHPRAGNGQWLGECWQWTASAYLAYPGYRPTKGALGEYNAKFMCNQMVLRGASCATPRSHARVSYRNFFPPASRWQFSGIRLAQ